jgi:hypothetical protein
MWRLTNRVPIASIARPDDAILSFEIANGDDRFGSMLSKKGLRDGLNDDSC